MYFTNEKENRIMKEISHYITILKDYVNKKKVSRKVKSKLVLFIKKKQENDQKNGYISRYRDSNRKRER